MQFDSRYNWLIARLLVISANIGGLIYIPREGTNLDWDACLLISIVWSIVLFIWLTATRHSQGVQSDDPYSWWKPFLPMKRFPIRFWLLASYSLMLGGLSAMSAAIISHDGREAVGGTFFFVGLLGWATIVAWIKNFGPNA